MMNKLVGNRDKRIALLLAAAFAWLFIGSLIIFHEEHVLGKHFKLSSQLFISPKSNDKQSLTGKLVKPLLKFHENGGAAGILTQEGFASIKIVSLEVKQIDSSTFNLDEFILGNHSLRAPPTI